MIYNRDIETMDRAGLEQLQIERLQSTLNRVYRNVSFYKQIFDERRIDIESIKSIDDIRRLPFTTKDDLRMSYPYGMFAVPLRDIVRIHSSAGKTGRPVAIGYTRNDLGNWSDLVARLLGGADIGDHDFVQIAFDYSMFTGAFGYHAGVEKIGASVIPSSSNINVQKQILIMKDYKTTVLLSTPGYAVMLANNLAEMGIHPEELNLRCGIFGAEPWNGEIRGRIEESLRIRAYNHYGVNAIVGPGVSGECEKRDGLHINEDSFIVEVIHPDTLEPVREGDTGELVFTTIRREGFPLIRYRTGDLSSIMPGQCSCGRTLRRMSRVSSRTDDLIVIMGVNLFPAQIAEVLRSAQGSDMMHRIIIDNHTGIDTLEIQVEVSDSLFNDEMKSLVNLRGRIETLLARELGISARIVFLEQNSLRKAGVVSGTVEDRR